MYCIVETMENSKNEQAGQACGLLPQRSVFRIKYGILKLSKLLSSCRQFSTISNCHMMAMGGVDWLKESWLTDNEECCVETVLWLPGISLTRNEQQRNGSCLFVQTCNALILIRLSCAAYWVAYLCSSQFHSSTVPHPTEIWPKCSSDRFWKSRGWFSGRDAMLLSHRGEAERCFTAKGGKSRITKNTVF